MNPFYLKVNEEDRNKLRGIDNIPHITLLDEMDAIPDEIKQAAKDLENAYQILFLKNTRKSKNA